MTHDIQVKEAKINVNFLNAGIQNAVDKYLGKKYIVFYTKAENIFAYPVLQNNKIKSIEVSFLVRKKDSQTMTETEVYNIGKTLEEEIHDLFDKCFGNIEEDEYSEEGGFCVMDALPPENYSEFILSGKEIPFEAVDFYWDIKREIPLTINTNVV